MTGSRWKPLYCKACGSTDVVDNGETVFCNNCNNETPKQRKLEDFEDGATYVS